MFDNTKEEHDDKTKLSAKEFILKYVLYLPYFIFSLAVSITVAYTYLRYKVPEYSSTLSLLIKDDTKSSGITDALVEGLGVSKKKPNLANEIAILKSANLMNKVVETQKLNTQYFFNGKVKTSEIYGKLPFICELITATDTLSSYSIELKFSREGRFQVNTSNTWYNSGDIFEFAKARFKVTVLSPTSLKSEFSYKVSWQTVPVAAQNFSKQLLISQQGKEATILDLGIITEVPEKGRNILNQLEKLYNQMAVEGKNKIVDNTVKFVDERLGLLAGELGTVEQGLKNYRVQNNIVDVQAQSSAQISEIQTIQDKLSEQEVKLRVVDMVNNYVSNPPNKYNLVPSSLGIEDPTLLSLISRYNILQLDREEKLKTMPAANSMVVVVENQIEKLRMSIVENLRNIRQSIASLRNRTQQEYNNISNNLSQVPAQQKGLLEIERQQGIKEKLFLFLLQKREESAITRASAVADSYTIDSATTSVIPVSPNRTNVYGYAIMLGLLVPILIIYLIELLNDKVTTRNDITKLTTIPILGEVAHNPEKSRELIINVKDRSALAEQFRILRTNLEFLMRKEQTPVLMVTSSVAGEGKTFTSMNVGAVWAAARKRTVILELDLRKPKISESLNIKNAKGITNYILGQALAAELPVPVPGTDNLFVVPTGPIPPNPSELLMDSKMDELFTYLRNSFDLVVIDSAPIGLVSDAKILAKFTDATLYIVRQRYTFKKQLHFVNDIYRKNELPNMGLLVNDVKVNGFSSYYGYGYGYGYGGYSYGNEIKVSWWKKLLQSYK